MCLTGCVRAVCSTAEVVLQQLMCSCGTGSSHQSDCGLMKKHLQKQTNKATNPQAHPLSVTMHIILIKSAYVFAVKTEIFNFS